MLVQVNGGSTNEPLCAVVMAGPFTYQLMVCGTALLLQTFAMTVMQVPGWIGLSHGTLQMTLHLPDCCAFQSDRISAGARARLKISTSSMMPRKKLFGTGNVPAPTYSELLLPRGAVIGPPCILTVAPSR